MKSISMAKKHNQDRFKGWNHVIWKFSIILKSFLFDQWSWSGKKKGWKKGLIFAKNWHFSHRSPPMYSKPIIRTDVGTTIRQKDFKNFDYSVYEWYRSSVLFSQLSTSWCVIRRTPYSPGNFTDPQSSFDFSFRDRRYFSSCCFAI